MGVAHLWEILKKAKLDLKLNDLDGKLFAVDLATWICESEGVKPLKAFHSRPYLRNLFFRLSILLKANVNLVFVLDGKAPVLKLETIAKRLATSKISKNNSIGIRSRLNVKLDECCKLLDTLGVPWIKAEGEAESLCAELNRVGLVDGVMTNDSDVFLYGAETVIRNICSEKNVVIEMYTMKAVSEKLGFDRNDLIALSLLLGCDYCPKGVAGIGVAQATRLLSTFKGVDSLEVFNLWRKSNTCHNASYAAKKSTHCSTCGHEGTKTDHAVSGCGSCKDHCVKGASNGQCEMPNISCICDWHRGEHIRKTYALEEKIKAAALQNPTFPDQKIIQEFTKHQKYIDEMKYIPVEPHTNFSLLKTKFQRTIPDLERASRHLATTLEWSMSYAFMKVLPLVTSFVLVHMNCQDSQIQLDSIIKKTVKNFIPSFDVKWKLMNEDLLNELPDSIDTTTVESQVVIKAAFPNEVAAFYEHLQKDKDNKIKTKAEMRKAARKCEGAAAKKNALVSSDARITDYFKVKKGEKCHMVSKSKTRQEVKGSSVESESIEHLEMQLQSLSVSNNIAHSKASVVWTVNDISQKTYQQQCLIKSSASGLRIKQYEQSGSALRIKPKMVKPTLLFSSDSESESDCEDNNLSAAFVGSQSSVPGCHIEYAVDVNDTTIHVNDDPDITFSKDLNFSLISPFVNSLNESLPSSSVNIAGTKLTDQTRVVQKSNSDNIARRCDGTSLSLTPKSSHECNRSDTDSPVFMTLMERLNARRNVTS